LIGQTLYHYRILTKIGENETGTLYRAVDQETEQSIALQVLAAAVVDDPAQLQRVKRDALTASSLEHPNLAQIHEFSSFGGVYFAAMEAPKGESVHDLLARERPNRRDLIHFARQIASALAAAHLAGIVHGPLNPAYIFISPRRQIKFYDFGFGCLGLPPKSEDDRRAFAGESASYFSPEHLEGSPVDVRSDIFSFGALVYHMTTGKRTFRKPTVSETWRAILEAEPEPLAQITRRVPQGMDKLLERCLYRNPQRRFQQMGDMWPLLETMVEAYQQNPDHKLSFVWKRPGQIAKMAGVVLAATAAVAAAVHWWPGGSTRDAIIGKELRPITSDAAYNADPVYSPDGSTVAYASDRSGEGNLDIWARPADGGDPRRLTGDPADDREPAFSPDGQTIAFRSERDGGGIYLVSAKGGEDRLLTAEGRRPRYSPDGRWIAYWVGPPPFGPRPDGAFKMFVIPSSGGAPRQIRANFASCTHPTWSPDSKSLLFVGRSGATTSKDPETTDWWVTSLDGQQLYNTGACRLFRREGILSPTGEAIPGDWKGNDIFFSTPTTEASSIWRATIAPGAGSISTRPVQVTTRAGIDLQPFASAQGRIAFSRQSYTTDIWGIPIAINEGVTTGPPGRWTHDPGANVSPSLPADGAKILFQSNRTGHYNLWSLGLGSEKSSPLMASSQDELWPVISPDGSKVAFTEMRIGRVEHFYKPINGGSKEILCDEDCGPTVSGWSSDSKMVLVDSFSHGARSRLAVSLIELSSRRRTMLLADPRYDLHQARFSPNGHWIAFAARGETGSSRLYLAPFHQEKPATATELVAVTDGTSWDAAPQWSPDGKLVYFASTRDGYRCIWAQRLNAANQPSGEAFAVAHLHSVRYSPTVLPFDIVDLVLGRDQILLSMGDQKGNIWSAKVSE
jgi:Tol biopolymer transport system component/serine/threonine protein kinase